MALRFPLVFDKNMAWVTFIPYEYQMPKVNIKPEEMKKNVAGVPIALFIPGDFNEQITAEWTPQEIIGGVAGGGGGWAKGAATEAGGVLEKQLGAKITNTGKAGLGKVMYPNDLLVFDNVRPIALNFSFNMIPFSQAEGDAITSIVKEFKKQILPRGSRDASSVVLEFPYVWDIVFSHIKGMGLEEDRKYRDMALMSVEVSFPSNTTNALTYKDGNPVQVNLRLGFQSIRKHFNLS